MFWNNQVEKEKEKEEKKIDEREGERKIYMHVRSLNGENDCPFYLTPCVRKDREKQHRSNRNVLVIYFHSFSW